MSNRKPHGYSNRYQDKPWYWRQIRKEIEKNLERDRIRIAKLKGGAKKS